MTYPTSFQSLSSGNQPLSLFDTMFNIVGQQGNIPCTASGTNAITLTPNTNYYAPAAYTNAQIVSFKAVATSTGAVTIQIGGLSLVNLYTAAGVQANAGDLVLNSHYEAQYWGDLNTGSGGFLILNAQITAVAQPVVSSFRNLKITNGGTPATQVAVTADAVVVQNGSLGTARVTSVNLTISTGSNGANALDTGSVAAQTWYFVYVIYNSTSTTVAGLISLSATSPTLPSGYTYYARVGAVVTDASTNLLHTLQLGNRAQYVCTATASTTSTGGNTPYPPVFANATAGTYSSTSPVLVAVTAVGTSCFAPTTASEIRIIIGQGTKSGTSTSVLLAPNTGYGGTNNGPNGSNGVTYPGWLQSVVISNMSVNITLESTTVAWASSASGGSLACLGWTDNL